MRVRLGMGNNKTPRRFGSKEPNLFVLCENLDEEQGVLLMREEGFDSNR
jgi:hypothetical protein